MNQLEQFIKQILFENNFFNINESIDNVYITPVSEKIAARMMTEGLETKVKIDDYERNDYRDIIPAFEILVDAYEKGDGAEYTFTHIPDKIKVNKQKIIDSISSSITNMSNTGFINYGAITRGVRDIKNFTKALLGLPPQLFDKIRNGTIHGTITDYKTKINYLQSQGKPATENQIKNLSIPKLKYYIESYIKNHTDKNKSFFFNYLATRFQAATVSIFQKIQAAERVAMATGDKTSPYYVPTTVDIDSVFGEKSLYKTDGGVSHQNDYEVERSEEMKVDERLAGLYYIISKIYYILKEMSPHLSELFKLKMIGMGDASNVTPTTTKSNIEIFDMFAKNKLSKETTEWLQKSLIENIEKKTGEPVDYSPDLLNDRKNEKFVKDKIKDAFNYIKNNIILKNKKQDIIKIIQQALSFDAAKAEKELPTIINFFFLAKQGPAQDKTFYGQKTKKIETEKAKQRIKKELYSFKKFVAYFNRLILKLQSMAKEKPFTETTLNDLLKAHTRFNQLKKSYPLFLETFTDFINSGLDIKDFKHPLEYTDKDHEDTLKQQAQYAGIDETVNENLFIFENDSEDDNHKLTPEIVLSLAKDIEKRQQLAEIRKSIRAIIDSQQKKNII